MPANTIQSVNPAEIQLENILLAMEQFTFSKDMSAFIVGGPKKLEKLVAEGKIFAVKKNPAQCGKWYCNAAHVLRHCKNMRDKK